MRIVTGRADDFSLEERQFDSYPLNGSADCVHNLIRRFGKMHNSCRMVFGKAMMASDAVFIWVLHDKTDFFRADETDIRKRSVTEKTGSHQYLTLFIKLNMRVEPFISFFNMAVKTIRMT